MNSNDNDAPFQRALLIAFLASALIASLIVGGWLGLLTNNLEKYPAWRLAESELGMPVMGTVAFAQSPQTLAGNQLNLGAFFGFHEIVTRDKEELSALSLRFRFEPDGYIVLLYNIRPDGFAGVRLSGNPEFQNIHFSAAANRAFQRTEPLNMSFPVLADTWHDVQLNFSATEMRLRIDGHEIGRFASFGGAQRIGFRSGHRKAWVDSVVLQANDGSVSRENFQNTASMLRVFALTFLSLIAFGAVILIIARTREKRLTRKVGLALVTINLTLVVLAAGLYLFQVLTADSYLTITPAAEEDWKQNRILVMNTMMQSQYSPPAGKNTDRVLVLGSSQTWGAGADHPQKTWVRHLERKLNAGNPARHIELMNAGVSGLNSAEILSLLRDDLLVYEPKLALVNLGNNDVDADRFKVNLEQIVGVLRERSIPVILMLEANSTEKQVNDYGQGDLGARHDAIREVAIANDLVVADTHAYLASRKSDGFLWWDFVHLTSFGQELLAERMYPEIRDALQRIDTTGAGK